MPLQVAPGPDLAVPYPRHPPRDSRARRRYRPAFSSHAPCSRPGTQSVPCPLSAGRRRRPNGSLPSLPARPDPRPVRYFRWQLRVHPCPCRGQRRRPRPAHGAGPLTRIQASDAPPLPDRVRHRPPRGLEAREPASPSRRPAARERQSRWLGGQPAPRGRQSRQPSGPGPGSRAECDTYPAPWRG